MFQQRRCGFTLIELLVVVAITAILSAILYPVLARVKENGRAARCQLEMMQLNSAVVLYTEENNSRFPDSRGMYYCRLLDIAHGMHDESTANGPYAIDLLGRYLRNKNIWLCPSRSANETVPAAQLWTNQGPFTWAVNCGGSSANRDVPSNYIWIHYLPSWVNPRNAQLPGFRVSGSSVSLVKHSSKAAMFVEMPYWDRAVVPHNLSGKAGVNMVFFDGHVATRLCPDCLGEFWIWPWEGWM
jgi:prepilin-type N-terminal cleavage/methylation domain-containing protein/prepilin-type processing-associated H-X9-DG protein